MALQAVTMLSTASSMLAARAGDAHPLMDIDWTIFLQFGVFVALFVVAKAFLFTPYLKLRERREQGIDGARAEAHRMSAEADAKLADYESKLKAARAKAAEEQRSIRAAAAAHEQEVTEQARNTTQAAWNEAQANVGRDVTAARADLLARADALAKQMASRLLGRQL